MAPLATRAKLRRRRLKYLVIGIVAGIVAVTAITADWVFQGYGGVFGSIHRKLASADTPAGVQLAVVASGFSQITDIQFVPGRKDQALVLQKGGTARLATFRTGKGGKPAAAGSSPVVFEVAVRTESELGLLGLAFHPKYADNGLFYVNFTPREGPRRTRISEWQLSRDQLGRERAREKRVILEVAQPYVNHNAGQLAFGPDGYLYIGLGDGGSAGDPHGHGQNLGVLLGKMLRIDVDRGDAGRPYAIPKDNPFIARAGARPEIWAYGLRNPWRYSFDPKGRLVVADVGQYDWEEVSIVEGGKNYGWNRKEGRHCYPAESTCSSEGLAEPVFEYEHAEGESITGGYVYTGRGLAELKGKYLCADYISGRVWALTLPDGSTGSARVQLIGKWPRTFTTFGRDERGELYLGDFGSGEILKLTR